MCKDENVRIVIKQGSGVPTVPVSADHRNGDWIATDIYEGEQYQDTDTGIVYTRSSTGIEVVGGGNTGGGLISTVVNIGDWDMDANANIFVTHGITDYTKIKSIDVTIIPDASTSIIPLTTAFSGTVAGAIGQTSSTQTTLYRTTGGSFDNVGYDSTGFNRGYVTYWHTV